jgi:hypothetical protein
LAEGFRIHIANLQLLKNPRQRPVIDNLYFLTHLFLSLRLISFLCNLVVVHLFLNVVESMKNLQQQLTQMLDARQISPQTTLAPLVGGKYNNNKFGTMTGMAANRRGQISRRGGTAY